MEQLSFTDFYHSLPPQHQQEVRNHLKGYLLWAKTTFYKRLQDAAFTPLERDYLRNYMKTFQQDHQHENL